MIELHNADQIIDTLGGNEAVAVMFDISDKAPTNWRKAGELPARLFAKMLWELNFRGFTARPSLWRQEGTKGLRLRRISE